MAAALSGIIYIEALDRPHQLVDLLTEYRAVWAIIRQWAGHDAAITASEARIRDLQRLLTSVMWDLRRPDPDCGQIAARISRAVHGQ